MEYSYSLLNIEMIKQNGNDQTENFINKIFLDGNSKLILNIKYNIYPNFVIHFQQ